MKDWLLSILFTVGFVLAVYLVVLVFNLLDIGFILPIFCGVMIIYLLVDSIHERVVEYRKNNEETHN